MIHIIAYLNDSCSDEIEKSVKRNLIGGILGLFFLNK